MIRRPTAANRGPEYATLPEPGSFSLVAVIDARYVRRRCYVNNSLTFGLDRESLAEHGTKNVNISLGGSNFLGCDFKALDHLV